MKNNDPKPKYDMKVAAANKLEGEDAIQLLKDGKEAWNNWVEKHPVADVSFEPVSHTEEFGAYYPQTVDFSGFFFPAGKVIFDRVNFKGANFSGTKFGDGNVSFYKTRFNAGHADFSNAKFGDGNVNFSYAEFGKDNEDINRLDYTYGVDFSDVEFGDGDVDFSRASFHRSSVVFRAVGFGKGDVNFSGATFSKGDVLFEGAIFSKGNVRFIKTIFGDLDVNFNRAEFNDGLVDFSDAKFGDGNVSFDNTFFNDENNIFDEDFARAHGKERVFMYPISIRKKESVIFSDANFGNGNVSFSGTTFKKGNVNFSNVNFGKGDVSLYPKTSKDTGKLIFEKAKVDGNLTFTIHKNNDTLDELNMSGISVNGRLTVECDDKKNKNINDFSLQNSDLKGAASIQANCNQVPDLRGTAFSHHVDLSQLTIDPVKCSALAAEEEGLEEASRKLIRLKQLAHNNHDFSASLNFHAEEMRCMRALRKNWLSKVLNWFYWATSNYGRSALLPALWWLGFVFLMTVILSFSTPLQEHKELTANITSPSNSITTKSTSLSSPTLESVILIAAGNALPFIPSKYSATTATNELLKSGFLIRPLLLLHSVISFILLFLVGLGIRNRFRI